MPHIRYQEDDGHHCAINFLQQAEAENVEVAKLMGMNASGWGTRLTS